ncbi:hypothetical protein [Planococcus faecalis]|uniref:Uncharacterized protein n=1 Tax=Planococcus faecalis TaxID=1598147 RepID=A0ABM6IP43_9BACL|nr:hypothetical protein [Planococcus faecalis]AQU78343.1 hypothetical protein AJGP001_03095 [Planococcus faecalis]OHX55263.1 hypothetical protein BB777_04510 [Planococcus faecalis]
MNWLPKRKNKVAAFWEWFADNKEAYSRLDESSRSKLLNQLEKKLHKVNKHLAFELSELLINDKRQFIISADGMVEAFDDVIDLVGQAPELESFTIIAFRQRQEEEVSIEYGDIKLAWKDIFCTFEKDNANDEVNLILYIKGFTEENEDEFISASFILLDTVIGEYNAGMRIGEIEFISYEGQADARPVKDLQSLF